MVPLQADLSRLAGALGAVLALLGAAPAAADPAAAQPGPWQLLGNEEATVAYPPGAEDGARVAASAASQAAPGLAEELGVPRSGPVRVELCTSHEQFEAQLGRRQSLWVLGVALPAEHRIVVKDLPPDRLRRLVVHELTHLYLDARLGSHEAQAPRWLHEGLAMYYEGPLPFADRLLLTDAAAAGRLHSIRDLDRFPADPGELALAYAESGNLVVFLTGLAPGKGISDFIDELVRTGSTERALLRTWGRSIEDLDAAWHAAITREYRRSTDPWTLQNAVFTAMALLAMVGWVRRRRRLARLAAEAAQQERTFVRAVARATADRDPAAPKDER